MKIIKTFKRFNEELYTNEWPMNQQYQGTNAGDVSSNPEFMQSENKFQQVQEHMKLILKPLLLQKNKNVDDSDIEKVSDSFFRLGNNKAQEVKKMVDNCKDVKQCAQEIVDKYYKYVKINFGSKDDANDAQSPL